MAEGSSNRLTRREFLREGAVVAANLALSALPHTATAQEQPPPPRKLKQVVTWGIISRIPPAQAFAELKRIGFHGVEMAPRSLWDDIRAAGLRIATIVGHGSLTDGLNRKQNHNRIEDELRHNIDLAAQYDIPVLICFSGNRRGISDEEGIANCVEGLKRVAPYAEQKGITLAMELLNSKVDHPDYQCDRSWWGVEVCKRVGSPRVKLLYDVYHMQIMEGDLIRTIRTHIQHIAHFHTAGNPGRRDPDETQEIYYPAVMRAIKELRFEGYIGHEFGPKGAPIEALRRAYQTCDV
ncbi:MAG: TIM barrel protein [Armatimonadota bacterium]|nr:TIM barrel protein [Armatimonadota bacterium]